jgi:hypothetical protein
MAQLPEVVERQQGGRGVGTAASQARAARITRLSSSGMESSSLSRVMAPSVVGRKVS